jgi:flagellar motor switch protein FliG
MPQDSTLDYDAMSGQDRAALVLSVLDHNSVKLVFEKMKDNDIKRLVAAMASIKKAPIAVVKRVLEDFYGELNEEDALLLSQNSGRNFILETLGEERAKTVFGQLSMAEGARTLEALELVDSKTLSNFLINEHPQTIALIIAHLEPAKKVDVLKRIPESLQAEVVLRMANIEFIAPELIAQLDDILKSELATLGSIDTNQLGGVQPVADMLNVMDKSSEQNILARVEEKDPQLAEEIRKLMFVFEDLVFVDDRGIQSLLKDVDNQKLVLALKTAQEDVKAKIFRNMSNRAVEALEDDLEAMGPVRLSDVEGAQQEIVNKAKELEAAGKLIVSRGGEGDAMV